VTTGAISSTVFHILIAHLNCQLFKIEYALLILADVEHINEIRRQLGSFKIQSAPKMMSRLGQCFTQARVSPIMQLSILDRSIIPFLSGKFH